MPTPKLVKMEEMTLGTYFFMNGKKYRLTYISEKGIGFKDVDYPEIKKRLPKKVVDQRLANGLISFDEPPEQASKEAQEQNDYVPFEDLPKKKRDNLIRHLKVAHLAATGTPEQKKAAKEALKELRRSLGLEETDELE